MGPVGNWNLLEDGHGASSPRAVRLFAESTGPDTSPVVEPREVQ